ncbi:MAG: hypothetical protein IPO08_22675 [Xanthomonadales bacterium]|nr:hypothetical protein [Xanthomonadales bacterium]
MYQRAAEIWKTDIRQSSREVGGRTEHEVGLDPYSGLVGLLGLAETLSRLSAAEVGCLIDLVDDLRSAGLGYFEDILNLFTVSQLEPQPLRLPRKIDNLPEFLVEYLAEFDRRWATAHPGTVGREYTLKFPKAGG